MTKKEYEENQYRKITKKQIKFLSVPFATNICSFCLAGEGAFTVDSVVTAIAGCNNCKVDIVGGGTWSGNGINALRRAYSRYPNDKRWGNILNVLKLTDEVIDEVL